MIVMQALMNRAFENGLFDIEPKETGDYVLRVRVFGMWVGIASMTKQELTKAAAALTVIEGGAS